MKCHTTLLSCAQANMAFEVTRSIVGHDHAGLAAPFDQRRQFPRHAPA